MVHGTLIRHDDRYVVAVPVKKWNGSGSEKARSSPWTFGRRRRTMLAWTGRRGPGWSRAIARDWDSDADRVYDQPS